MDSGGCNGFQYKLELTKSIEPEDMYLYHYFDSFSVFVNDGTKVVVDPSSLDLIKGSTLDYTQELIGSSFQVINNPLADSACGCKASFNIKL